MTTSTGVHEFGVWIAADDESRERGLMYVRELPPDRGMLFVFERPQALAFWMKDTYLSLDLIFIDPAGRVLNVAAHARPHSLNPIRSEGDAIAVLEVLAGTARAIGLEAGRSVEPADFANDRHTGTQASKVEIGHERLELRRAPLISSCSSAIRWAPEP